MMSRFIKAGACMTLLAVDTPVLAGNALQGQVSEITVSQTQGLAYVNTNGVRSGQPACATYTTWVFSIVSMQGQALLSQIIAAKGMGRKIDISGTASCIELAGYESINYVTMF
jgi:hypothetical protein